VEASLATLHMPLRSTKGSSVTAAKHLQTKASMTQKNIWISIMLRMMQNETNNPNV